MFLFSLAFFQYLELLWITETTESEPVDKEDFCRELNSFKHAISTYMCTSKGRG